MLFQWDQLCLDLRIVSFVLFYACDSQLLEFRKVKKLEDRPQTDDLCLSQCSYSEL